MERLSTKDLALFEGLSESESQRFFSYLFSIPKKAGNKPNLRSQAIGLYDPFWDRHRYPLGILWQSAPYSFCNHGCVYCYGRSYLHQFTVAIKRCLELLANVPPEISGNKDWKDMLN